MSDALQQAIHDTVHEYPIWSDRKKPRGAVALAPMVNMQAGTLSNKANTIMETHQLTLAESIPIQREAQDYRITDAYCMTLGGVFLRFHDLKFVSDQQLLDVWAKYIQEDGETAKAVSEALADGNINEKEMDRIEKEVNEDIQAKLELLHRVKEIYQQGKSKNS